MIVTISPTKSQNFDGQPCNDYANNIPEFQRNANELNNLLKGYNVEEISSLMNISQQLARNTYEEIQMFDNPNDKRFFPASYLYSGVLYTGLDFKSLSTDEKEYAQKHLLIVSGLYGFLKPLDCIKPYRLEMNTKLPNDKGDNLLQYWGDTLTEALRNLLTKEEDKVWIILSSEEYSKVIDKKDLGEGVRIINIAFKEVRDGDPETIMVYTKKARGLMARYIIQNKLTNCEDIKLFDVEGYKYSEPLSTIDSWTFIR